MKQKIILGIDPGSRITGYGIISTSGRQHEFMACGRIQVEPGSINEKLWQIYQALDIIVREYKPDIASIETVFMYKNALSALKLGQARGAAIVAIAAHDLALHEYSPRQVKRAVTGSGSADKEQVNKMVRLLLSLDRDQVLQEDAADALAIAICCANICRFTDKTSMEIA